MGVFSEARGRARINARAPRAGAICDRCGFRYNHYDLSWQTEWQGPRIVNLRRLVCPTCLDIPQQQLHTVAPTADPVPIHDPRPETADMD